MMVLNFLLFLSITILFTASDPFFGSESILAPALIKSDNSNVNEKPWIPTDAFRPYLFDKNNLVSDKFKISPFFYPNVNFWFMIYTQFESTSVLFHDKNNLSIIYKILDFSYLHKKGLQKNTLYLLQKKISLDKLDEMKRSLNLLTNDPFSYSQESKNILRSLTLAKVKVPISRNERIKFFKQLEKNIRTQTGQKNFIQDGLVRSAPYQNFLKKYFKDKNLPAELFVIPFLESSFNPRAESKVSALGVWQFMPLIASYYVPKRTSKIDYRSNVGVSSISAGFLMSENYSIMKSWDLAVTAYNSGTKHLLKTKRSISKANISLEDIIKNSDSAHFGFASKNFYSEFLALSHAIAYRHELFSDLNALDRTDLNSPLKFFMSKCLIRLKKDLNPTQLDDFHFHNHHLDLLKSEIPRGIIVTTKSDLPPNKFHLISYNEIIKTKPKDWSNFLKNYSCSTK